ncbi:MAG: hypothetical protein K2X87_32975 [Gemmataceae bacterium]|nr:hypothetical protein [Gemmataceae bacterium]
MEPSPLQERVKARPFIPFAVTLSSGRVVNVTGPEMIILGRRADTVAFVDEQRYDRLVIILHDHINSVDAYDPHQSSTPPG